MGQTLEGRQIQCPAAGRAEKIPEVLSNRGEPMAQTESPKARDSWGAIVLGGGLDL
jgi:hypothetical protein